MAIGKYLSLEEAQKEKKLDRFCKEHPSQGDEDAFDSILNRMSKNLPVAGETSTQDDGAC